MWTRIKGAWKSSEALDDKGVPATEGLCDDRDLALTADAVVAAWSSAMISGCSKSQATPCLTQLPQRG